MNFDESGRFEMSQNPWGESLYEQFDETSLDEDIFSLIERFNLNNDRSDEDEELEENLEGF